MNDDRPTDTYQADATVNYTPLPLIDAATEVAWCREVLDELNDPTQPVHELVSNLCDRYRRQIRRVEKLQEELKIARDAAENCGAIGPYAKHYRMKCEALEAQRDALQSENIELRADGNYDGQPNMPVKYFDIDGAGYAVYGSSSLDYVQARDAEWVRLWKKIEDERDAMRLINYDKTDAFDLALLWMKNTATGWRL